MNDFINAILTIQGIRIIIIIVSIVITIMLICAIFSIQKNVFDLRNILVDIEKGQDEEIELLREIAGYETEHKIAHGERVFNIV